MTKTARVLTNIACVIVIFASCGKDSPHLPTAMNFDTFEITSCTPVNFQRGVNPDDVIIITFNNKANIFDIEQFFTLTQNGSRIEGQFSWITQNVVRFIPRYQMQMSQRFVISLPRTVRDYLGNPMARDFISEFYVGNDFSRPGVILSMPAYVPGGAIIDPDNPVDPNHDAMSAISITFSKNMDRLKTQEAFSISPNLSGYFDDTIGANQIRYVFTTQPQYGTQYKVTISAAAQDQTGNTLTRDFIVLFTVGIDMTPPVVTAIGDGVNHWVVDGINEGVEKNIGLILVDFSKAMDRSSAERAFSLSPGTSGYFTWTADNQHLSFIPTTPLIPDTVYTIQIDTSALDSHGLHTQAPYQVVMRTNGPNSQRISVDNVDGRTIAAAPWTDLAPEQTTWPMPVNLSGGNTYQFRVHFTAGGSAVAMNRLSIFGNCLVESSILSQPPSLTNITWDDDSTAIITINALFTNTLYRLTIVGGVNGVKDTNGNPMAGNYVIDFRQ